MVSQRVTCPFCGTAVSADARYCTHCGTPLSAAPTPSRSQVRSPGRIAVWGVLVLLFALFGTGAVGGFRYQAGRWPWTPPAEPVVIAPEVTRDPLPRPRVENSAIARYLQSVVSVRTRGSQGEKSGSGFIMNGRGHVVTVAHVLDGLEPNRCVTVVDENGRPHHQAVLVGKNEALDVAVLEVPTLAVWPSKLKLGSASGILPGDPLHLLGTPRGVSNAISLDGSYNRMVSNTRIDGQMFQELMQITGALISEGSSGGPVIDRTSGRVVGIITAGTGGQISYAVPMETEVTRLIENWAAMPSVGACTTENSTQSVAVTLGAILPLSGPEGLYGSDLVNGALLAIRDMEADLRRVGYEVTLRSLDDEGNPNLTQVQAAKLESDPAVVGVIGSLDSQATRALAEWLKSSKLPVVAPMAGADELTQPNWPHFSRLVANTGRQSQALAQFARERLHADALVILQDGTTEAAAQLKGFETAAQVISLPILDRIIITSTTDYAGLHARLTELKADSIFYAGRTEAGLRAVTALRQEGINLPILGTDALYDPVRLESLPMMAAHSIFFTSTTLEDSEAFRRHFEGTLGKVSRGYAAYGYDAARVILDALVRYGSKNPAEVPGRAQLAEAVRQTKLLAGRATTVTLDENGDNRTASIYIFEWKSGQVEQRQQLQ